MGRREPPKWGRVASVERPKVDLESSVISYLAARPSRDILATAHQQVTREWWDRSRSRFDLFVSGEVLNEIRRYREKPRRMPRT